MKKLVIITPFPNHPTQTQIELLKNLDIKIFKLSKSIELCWLIGSTYFFKSQCESSFSLPIQSENLVTKRYELMEFAYNLKSDVITWMDADDLPTENYLTALKQFHQNNVLLGLLNGVNKSYEQFKIYTTYSQWLRTSACEDLTKGNAAFMSGSCLVFRGDKPSCLTYVPNEKYSGVEDVCWAYNLRESSQKIPIMDAVKVYPSITYGGSDHTEQLRRTNLLREFYKENGYIQYSQVGYGTLGKN